MLDRLEITDSTNCVQLMDLLGLDQVGSYMERLELTEEMSQLFAGQFRVLEDVPELKVVAGCEKTRQVRKDRKDSNNLKLYCFCIFFCSF